MKLFGDDLQASHVGARTEALANRTRKLAEARDEAIARADAMRDAARARHDRELADAQAAVTKRADELDARLAKDIRTKLPPVAARFATAPRESAIEIARLWRSWQAQAQDELGETLLTAHIIAAFLAAAGRLDAMGNAGTLTRFDSAPLSAFQPDAGYGASVVEQALRGVELVVDGGLVGLAPDAERTEVFLSHATQRRQGIALATFDKQRALALAEERDRGADAARAIWRAQNEKNALELVARRSSADRAERFMNGEPEFIPRGGR